ncbi:MAG: PilZ domain-containing protein [Bryobacterales bacterium]|nr:PilZ domain-containing protein [Bryobacterales bacterium]
MAERRLEPRLMCADLVEIFWRDQAGRSRKATAILEDISLSGACLQLDGPVPLKSAVRIHHPRSKFQGTVRYCVYREIGYFLGIEFGPGCRWSRSRFRPQHLLDLRQLMERGVRKAAGRTPRGTSAAS